MAPHTAAAGRLSVSAVGGAALYQAGAPAAMALAGPRSAHWPCEPLCGSQQDLLTRAADAVGVDRHLVTAVAWAESAFRPDAVSPKGAMGLMQLMPGTARQYGVTDAFDPWQNLQGGTRLLRDLLTRYAGDTRLALAAYNAGAGAVERAGRAVPNYPETQNYVTKVLDRHARLRGEAGLAPDPVQPAAATSVAGGVAQARLGGVSFTAGARQIRESAFSQRQIGNALLLMPDRSPGNLLAARRP